MAANVLGVVALADDDPEGAVAAFLDAAGAHPRSVRPSQHAMARSNLALAHERAGSPAHAALAARQALAMAALPADARQQAEQVARRCATDGDPLVVVLAGGAPTDHAGLLRAELARVLATGPHAAHEHAAAVAAAVAAHPDRVTLSETWLDAVLEQPPEPFRVLLEAYVVAAERDEDTRHEVARALDRAMVRFHAPQWMRVRDTVAKAAQEQAAAAPWG
jgi:D-serine deaminase-like pyridoxal phosphate-dependent protein